MDGRVLINTPGTLTNREEIAELNGWRPGEPEINAGGPIRSAEPVSLIVPTFFNAELKRRSLRHLLNGVEAATCVREIILVASDGENMCFEDLAAIAPSCPIRVVDSDPHNRGKSRNSGAAAARYPWLLFLDDDMLVRSWRWIDVLLSRLLQSHEDGALFPRRHYAKFPLLFDPPLLESTIREWRIGGGAGKNMFLYDPLLTGARDLPMLFCFPGCFMLMNRDAFQRIGGFAEDFVGWGFEDTEFGQRAIRELRILNLFRQGEPLLHIDHPVSPYKSEEHNANYHKFYAAAQSVDINLFCRGVFRGQDFAPARQTSAADECFAQPFEELARRGVPIDADDIAPFCKRMARKRLHKHLGPLPKFIALHGSRAEGAGDWDDDYDVLALYCGEIQEFHVSRAEPRVEVECADIYHFEHIAAHPAVHSVQGLMELSKIAKSQLLWGNNAEWKAWSGKLLHDAQLHGWCFWLVLGLGLRWHAAKYGAMVERYLAGLRKLHATLPAPWYLTATADIADKRTLCDAARHALDEFSPAWRQRLADGEPIFELQVPEVWTALHWLSRPGGCSARKARVRARVNGIPTVAAAVG